MYYTKFVFLPHQKVCQNKWMNMAIIHKHTVVILHVHGNFGTKRKENKTDLKLNKIKRNDN